MPESGKNFVLISQTDLIYWAQRNPEAVPEKRIVALDMERSNCYDPYLTCLRHWCFHRLYGRPHFSAEVPKYKEMLKDHNVKVTSIDPDDYAALDGEAILESALEFYEEG